MGPRAAPPAVVCSRHCRPTVQLLAAHRLVVGSASLCFDGRVRAVQANSDSTLDRGRFQDKHRPAADEEAV